MGFATERSGEVEELRGRYSDRRQMWVVEAEGVEIPIVPGIMPITNYTKLARFSDAFAYHPYRYPFSAPESRGLLGGLGGQVPLVVKAGTVAFTHYDIWHGTAANRSSERRHMIKLLSSERRHMIKFLFRRTESEGLTWNHDPASRNRPTDWSHKDGAEDVNNIILTFSNPLGVSQSDHYRERDQLMGKAEASA